MNISPQLTFWKFREWFFSFDEFFVFFTYLSIFKIFSKKRKKSKTLIYGCKIINNLLFFVDLLSERFLNSEIIMDYEKHLETKQQQKLLLLLETKKKEG